MKIARVIMDGKITKAKIYQGNPWNKHREGLFKEYEKNFECYFGRVQSIVQVCEKERVDLLLLPACTLLYKTPSEHSRYPFL